MHTTKPWVRSEEEPLLARYLAARVCARAAGAAESVCTHTAPRDKYFVGSLRPCPKEAEAGAEVRPTFLDELLTKLAPVAFGADFLLRPSSDRVLTDVRIEWSCYYRVFPSLDEQRLHQRHKAPSPMQAGTIEAGLTQADEETPEVVDGAESTDAPESADGGVALRRRHKDVLFPKYRKIRCAAAAPVVVHHATPGCDIAALETAVLAEIERAKETILLDEEHLRVAGDLDARLRVPSEALDSEMSYATFKSTLATPVIPRWRWSLAASVRPAEEQEHYLLQFEAANVSEVEPKAWHSEGFLFDVQMTFKFHDADVRPFTLALAPHNFRYDPFLWGRGFNCGVVANLHANSREFRTVNAPVFEQPRYETSTEPAARFAALATDPVPVLQRIAAAMESYKGRWQSERERLLAGDASWWHAHGAEYDRDNEVFSSEAARFMRGCELIQANADVRLAFQLTNQAFAASGDKTGWRLFQIVFLVSQLPGIQALSGRDEVDIEERATVDIVFFPTGGGKTEAYLAVIVFHCFYDRLRGKTAGVTAWTRFPLRLLTLQQTQRVANVVGTAELVRKAHSDSRLSGRDVDGFAVGYFVGQEATPNELTPPRRGEPPDPNWSTASDETARQRWKKIVKCPACRTSSITIDLDPVTVRLLHRCTNRDCRFPGGVVPVYVIDNEIYRYLPTVVVGTIDKLAGLGNQRKLSMVLGRVTGRCTHHGYYSAKCCQKDCADPKRLVPRPPRGISGPTLLVQDELHLLKEGLGTFDGHYETFLQTVLRRLSPEHTTKIIASSATIEAFDRQVLHLYGRRARVFPGLGPSLGNSFYADTRDYPQRLFVGLLPHNKTIFNATLELFQHYHEEIQSLLRLPVGTTNPFGGRIAPSTPEWQELMDPYATSLGYFSATRELSSVRTDLEAHVNTELEREGYQPLRIAELSGSTSTDAVTAILEALESPIRSSSSPNNVLATSMISHGVDIDRFNCMIFYGMPRQNAEYIQASSRVGRSHVGIVFTCLKPARERDQSHFSYFSKYHEFLGQLVEPVAINRWSKFSVNRTVPGLFMGVLLQHIANTSGQDNPNRFYMVDFVKRLIAEGSLTAESFRPLLHEAYLVDVTPGVGPRMFRDEIDAHVRRFLDQILGAGGHATFVSDALVPPPMRSLRDVDEQIVVELDSNGTAWASRTGR